MSTYRNMVTYVEFLSSNYDFNALDTAEAATGVRLEFVDASESSAYEQFNLMIAGGDMTDLLPVREYYTGGLSMAYGEDIIIDINPYVEENMPNYAAVYATLDEKTQKETLTDGMMLAFSIIADGYRSYIEWVRGLMAEGVLYEDFLSLDGDMMIRHQSCGTGATAVWQANADKIEEIVQQFSDGAPDMAVCAVPNVTADPDAPYVWLQDTSLVTTNNSFSISTDCKDPELVCQWMNYFWTTDGYYLSN